MEQKLNTSGRIYDLDVLRALACCAVVMIHASAQYASNDVGTLNFFIGNFWDSLSRFAVPVFVMISGALLLGEDHIYSAEKNKRRILRMVRFFVFWSLVYCVGFQMVLPVLKHEPFDLPLFLRSFFSGSFHLWFCYMIVGLYLILPLLRLWVKRENVRQVRYFILLAFLFSAVLPLAAGCGAKLPGLPGQLFGSMKSSLSNLGLEYVGGYTAFFLLGWYLRFYEVKRKKLLYAAGIAATVILYAAICAGSLYYSDFFNLYKNETMFVFLQAAAVFVFVKDRCRRSERMPSQFVASVSRCSLGIYAMHVAVLTFMSRPVRWLSITNAALAIPFLFVTTFGVSWALSALLGRMRWTRPFVE